MVWAMTSLATCVLPKPVSSATRKRRVESESPYRRLNAYSACRLLKIAQQWPSSLVVPLCHESASSIARRASKAGITHIIPTGREYRHPTRRSAQMLHDCSQMVDRIWVLGEGACQQLQDTLATARRPISSPTACSGGVSYDVSRSEAHEQGQQPHELFGGVDLLGKDLVITVVRLTVESRADYG